MEDQRTDRANGGMIEPDCFRFGLKAMFVITALLALWLFDFVYGSGSIATPIFFWTINVLVCVLWIRAWIVKNRKK